jgi:PST family polysaccharide transporter
VIVDPLGVLAWAAASIALAANGAGVWSLVAGSYASMLVQVVAAWWFVHFVPRWRLASFAMWRELASFARSVIFAEILRRVATQMDALMLGKFQGTAPLGQYRNGLRLVSQPGFAFVSVTAYVLYPAFARLAAAPERISAAARRVYWISMTAAVPVSFASIPLGVPLAIVFFGTRWRPAGHAIAALCGIVLGTTIVSIASELFKSISRPRALVGVQALGFVLILISVTVTAIIWGLVGVAIAMSASTCATAAFALARVSALVDIDPRSMWAWFAGPLGATAVMIPAMFAYASGVDLLSHGEATRVFLLFGEIVVGVLVYGLVLAAVDGRRRREALAWLRRRRGVS